MKQTVYVDVLISVNLLVDYFLLYAAAVISGRGRDRVRMCLGAAIGAVGSLVIFLPKLPQLLTLLLAVLLSAAMTFTAFVWRGWHLFLRSLLVMYTMSICYSGIMLLLWDLSGGSNISVNNGAVYINIDPKLLILTTVVLYAAISVFSGRISARGMKRRHCTLTFYEKNERLSVEGIIDTGNMLTEPFSGIPVIVADIGAVAAVLPEGIDKLIQGSDTTASTQHKVRFIPYHTASGSGVMLAYRPERIDIELDGKTTTHIEAYLALTDSGKMTDGVLVNPDTIDH